MTVGAILLETTQAATDVHKFNQAMRTLWSIFYHGKTDHRGLEATSDVSILPEVPYGQATIRFCSVDCVRRFFATLCDTLDTAVTEADARFTRGD